jgi:hypothetical protein
MMRALPMPEADPGFLHYWLQGADGRWTSVFDFAALQRDFWLCVLCLVVCLVLFCATVQWWGNRSAVRRRLI